MIQQPQHQDNSSENDQYLNDFRIEAEKHDSIAAFLDFLIDRIRIKLASDEYKERRELLNMLEGSLLQIETQMNALAYFSKEKYYGSDELKSKTADFIERTNDKFKFVAKNLNLILE